MMSSSFRSSQYRSIEVVNGPHFGLTLAIVVVGALAQAAFGHFVAVRGTVPSIVAIAVVLYAIRVDFTRAIVMGALAGLLEDGIGGTGGAWLTATTLVAAGSIGLARVAFSDGVLQSAAYVVLAVVVRDALFWGVERIQGFPAGLFGASMRTALVQAAFTAILAAAYLFYRLHYVREETSVQRR